jgi:conjugative relaxase-like TrwC/TraI family protein
MLFVTASVNAQQAKDYFTRHMDRDYYLRDSAEFPGEWHGRGAEMLDLKGQVDKQSYFRLCDNLDPRTGEPLTPRTKANRRVLYDFTFNSPKSVTLAYELGKDERIMTAFHDAVSETQDEMENEMKVRVRAQGRDENRPTCNMVWAGFTHRTARPVTEDGVSLPDPHLHYHALGLNVSYDPVERRWKAGQFETLVRHKGYYQAAFLSRLAKKMTALGYGVERDGKSFRIVGIDPELCGLFSRRTEIIEEKARELGITNPEVKAKVGVWTREAKPEEQMDIRELRKEWLKRITEGQRDAIVKARLGRQTAALDAQEAVDYALSHCFERQSTETHKNLLKTALTQSFGKAAPEDIRNEVMERGDILHREWGGQHYVTTEDVRAEERNIIDFVREGRGTRSKLGGGKTRSLDPALSQQQQDAALVILNSRDRVTELKGRAGTGKTRMLLSTVSAITAAGNEVYAFAPSADAAAELQSAGFGEAATVERLLIDQQMQEKVHGGVLLIDEAGLLSVKDAKRLFDVAKKENARVILVGDTKQHTAVTRGDALRILEKNADLLSGTLKENRRQITEGYRKAVEDIAEGDTLSDDGRTRLRAGIEALDSMGAIVESQGEDRYRRIAQDYVAATSSPNPRGGDKSALVVSPTHKEADHLTSAIREVLKESGRLSRDEREFTVLRPLKLTEAERTDFANYHPGAIIQFHQSVNGFNRREKVRVVNAGLKAVRVMRAGGREAILPFTEASKFQVYQPETLSIAEGEKLRITQNGNVPDARAAMKGGKTRLNNGAIYDVAGFTDAGDIRLTNGFVIPKDYGSLAHGYVVTSQASQGKTVDHVLVALGSESFACANREQFYVSVSRGRESVKLYTDDKEAMMEAVQSTSARLSATELMEAQNAELVHQRATARRRLAELHHTRRSQNQRRVRNAAYDLVQALNRHQQQKGITHGRH